jgi:D-glutamate cyclase
MTASRDGSASVVASDNGDGRGVTDLEPFENLDRIATVEMRTQGIPKGIVRQLYGVARTRGPLSHALAEALLKCAGGRVAIFTGIVCEPLPRGEVDGPVGAAILAETLEQVGVAADVIVPPEMLGVSRAVKASLAGRHEVLDTPRAADDYVALVSIEKLGRNEAGATHTILGTPIEQEFVADDLIEQFNEQGRLTIAIGDGGNEVGFGAIYSEALELVPRGRDCGCPCGGGIICTTATELLFPAAVSNFGAYAVACALGVLVGRPAVCPQPDDVGSAVAAAIGEGCVDGGTFYPHVLADDGIPLKGVEHVVGVMRTIVEQSFRSTPRTG